MVNEESPLTNLQRELLTLFAQDVSEQELNEIKQLISSYFAEKAMDLADKAWEEKGWTDEDAIKLSKTKMRTTYPKKIS
ncbi:hypothetical protein [Cognataquiflexum rubidum]|uniref:hypothetical protein n=1 Tax=Cognataquiflexum rubidum TaxID=2922273 RepID=UPI001F138946|nr:hypothetical protein [Cognataquiflexum rubidum]MCH6234902.1 hypothetical protein [Cognataquiflexum rubidum]